MDPMSFDNLIKINTKKLVRDISSITKSSNTICKKCQCGKQSRVSFKKKEYTTSKPLELVHINLRGPTRI
jgi:hypothetical protein